MSLTVFGPPSATHKLCYPLAADMPIPTVAAEFVGPMGTHNTVVWTIKKPAWCVSYKIELYTMKNVTYPVGTQPVGDIYPSIVPSGVPAVMAGNSPPIEQRIEGADNRVHLRVYTIVGVFDPTVPFEVTWQGVMRS